MRRFTVVLEPSDEGFFAFVPSLPGCTSWGATQGEAIENVREAITLALEYAKEHGLPLPEENNTMVAEVLI